MGVHCASKMAPRRADCVGAGAADPGTDLVSRPISMVSPRRPIQCLHGVILNTCFLEVCAPKMCTVLFHSYIHHQAIRARYRLFQTIFYANK